MNTPPLGADCTQCAALCCVALAFDRSELFAFDKPAGQPCRHLGQAGRCRIHADRARQGFKGCAAYDCLGAGQYVSQRMFSGRSWREDPSLLRPMMDAFAAVRQAHEQLAMLRQARTLPMPPSRRAKLEEMERRLAPAAGWASEDVAAGRVDAALEDVRRFLTSLRPFTRPPVRRARP